MRRENSRPNCRTLDEGRAERSLDTKVPRELGRERALAALENNPLEESPDDPRFRFCSCLHPKLRAAASTMRDLCPRLDFRNDFHPRDVTSGAR